MPISRAMARSDRAGAPTSPSWRSARSLISAVSSARTRSRAVRGDDVGGTARASHTTRAADANESAALDRCRPEREPGRRSRAPISLVTIDHHTARSPMRTHVVVGAGPVGTATARLLTDRGEDVVVVTRSGSGPDGTRRVRLDATDAERLAAVASGAVAIYDCANPPYHRWPTDWPPLHAALLQVAERTGAVLATVSNLYAYGAVDRPMTEDMPLASAGAKGRVRAAMWRDALAAHEAGRVRVTEVRGSDYACPGPSSHLGDRVVPRVLAGRPVTLLGDADVAHTWTSVDDVARLLVTVAADERGWGRAWHVPSAPPRTQREVVADLCRA